MRELSHKVLYRRCLIEERNKNLSPHEHDIMCFIFDSISCGGERENREKIKKSREKKENRKARFFAAAKTIYETYTYRYRYTEERERECETKMMKKVFGCICYI